MYKTENHCDPKNWMAHFTKQNNFLWMIYLHYDYLHYYYQICCSPRGIYLYLKKGKFSNGVALLAALCCPLQLRHSTPWTLERSGHCFALVSFFWATIKTISLRPKPMGTIITQIVLKTCSSKSFDFITFYLKNGLLYRHSFCVDGSKCWL